MMNPQALAYCGLSRQLMNTIVTSVLINLMLVSQVALAEDNAAEATADERTAHLTRMRTVAQSIKVNELRGNQRTTVDLVEEPVLRYTDNTREQYDSTMWIWGKKGRPTAIMAVEYYPRRPREQHWLFEIASLSTDHITAEHEKQLKWKARDAGLKFQILTNAPAPAESPAARLSQMKQLQQRLFGYERALVGGRIELRPLARPLYRYRDDSAGILDGAIFAFANGTNPEILWVVEARQNEKGAATWEFGLAQMTGAEVFVELDGKQIWFRGEADPPTDRETYVNGWLSSEVGDK